MTPSLLLPVETLNREFDGKLLLALEAAERGWDVVIGKRSTVHDNLHLFRRSVYFSKGLRAGNRTVFRILADLGHVVMALDEEGLVSVSDEMLLMKMDPEVLSRLSAAFAWGEHDAAIYRAADKTNSLPVIATGNPRVDLLRRELASYYASEMNDIVAQFGRFALLNTNFAMVNHFIKDQTRFKTADWVAEEKVAKMKSGLLGHKARLFHAFLDLVPRLAEALRPHALVIRPHPSESHQAWMSVAEGLDNVHVLHEGGVVPWLRAAGVLIHNGCTSAVEAAVLGTPALAYRPVKQPGFDNDLPNGLSREVETPDELLSAARALLDREREDAPSLSAAQRDLLARRIAALDGPLACVRILDEIERRLGTVGEASGWTRRLAGRARATGRRLSRSVRKRSATSKGNPIYLRHKFPGISAGEVEERIRRSRRTLGRFDGFGAEEIKPNLFRIRRR